MSRTEILLKRGDALAAYQQALTSAMEHPPCSPEELRALEEAGRHFETALQLEAEYFRDLPRMTLSLCPLCGQPLVRSFDPFGLDGLFWRSSATPEEPLPCRHFCVLAGALDLKGQPPHGGDFEAHVGPQVPFVIPRLLEHPDMVAVVSAIDMANGSVAYPIGYFAERRPPPQALTAGWARTNYLYQTQLGEVRWRIPNDPLDFELRPWAEKGKLRWCEATGDQLSLSQKPAGDCPFIDLRGERRPMIVQRDRSWHVPPPDGQIVRPF